MPEEELRGGKTQTIPPRMVYEGDVVKYQFNVHTFLSLIKKNVRSGEDNNSSY